MYKEKITFTNFNDDEVTDVLYFNLTKKELTDLKLSGFTDKLDAATKHIKDGQIDGAELYRIYSELTLAAYGKKSDDGMRFIKNKGLVEEFEQSCAFEAFLDLLIDDPNKLESFVLSVMPKSMMEAIEKEYENAKKESEALLNDLRKKDA